jgi:hypothetical protein
VNTHRLQLVLPALGALFLFTAASDGCGGSTDPDPDPVTEQTLKKGLESSIAPPSPLVPSTTAIPLTSPTFSRTFAPGAPVVFQHSLDGYQHGIVVVLEARPEVAQGRVVNLLTDCVAGAASMAGHVFDGSLSLGSSTSDFYACTGEAREPFSKTTKVKTCRAGTTCTSPLQPDQDYWWFVLGYDDQMRLTHSSAAYLFRWKE